MTGDLVIRPAETDADLAAWNRVRRILLPDEPIPTLEQLREGAATDRLLLLAEVGGVVAGHGFAGRSSFADGFAEPRVLPEHRRHGIGSAVLEALLAFHSSLGHVSVASHVEDESSLGFATAHGFVEIDRQVEQVREIAPDEPAPPLVDGIEFASVAEDPGLVSRAYRVAEQGYADMPLAGGSATVALDEWLRDEATLPGGSIVALADGEVVGYAGLIAFNDDPTRAENGLTVVDRAWRGRGLAAAMKRRQLAWAAANGLREIVTWTQQNNETMQHVNVGLGYRTRSISRTVRRDRI
jgi:GNAT superfamily N-acetyltransferase